MPDVDAVAATAVPEEVRNHLALALDVDDLVAAARLAKELQPWFAVAKVGLELFSAAGPDAVVAMLDLGYRVFVDLKLCDIPNTVARSAEILGGLGAGYLTMHGFGGPVMLRAGAEALAEGAAAAGLAAPTALAVTVLTSEPDAEAQVIAKRVQAALEAGCGGVVCAASDLPEVKRFGPRLLAVVPGIRLAGTDANDQRRPSTPDAAIAAGADLLVVGRAVTTAPDRAAAAADVAALVARALTSRSVGTTH
jgi:orotidine-5'-phosphate decarboxylase